MQCTVAQSSWVHLGPEGRLVYAKTDRGDRIADFSYAGYEGGGVRIPHLPAARIVSPTGHDDFARIQQAIDEVSSLPMVHGFRGAVQLRSGVYYCSRTLVVKTSGVVLRGEGVGTILTMTGDPHVAIVAAGKMVIEETGNEMPLAAAYISSGAQTLSVADLRQFKSGDTVRIRKPITKTWIAFMGMDKLRRNGKEQRWLRTDHLDVIRRVTSIRDNQLVLDVPLMDNYDSRYFEGQHASLQRVRVTGQLAHVGVESLEIVAPQRSITLGEPEYGGIDFESVADSWIRAVGIEDATNPFYVGPGSERVTVTDCDVRRNIPVKGAAKPFDYATNGSQILFDRCRGNGDNTYYFATHAQQQGPVVLLHCSFHGDGHIQPHQRWSPGLLIDNCDVVGGGIDLKNRGEMGSGHGWTTGWSVAWNNTATTFEMNQAPGVLNWSIGNRGRQFNPGLPVFDQPNGPQDGAALPAVITESPNMPVKPPSLYLEQLKERLGADAVRNIGY
ncbi:MAG: hypothetical protein P4K83_10470 [Terracidiphilus sp.]|nr:hypothetical protein [Terracidiphilus sp.]